MWGLCSCLDFPVHFREGHKTTDFEKFIFTNNFIPYISLSDKIFSLLYKSREFMQKKMKTDFEKNDWFILQCEHYFVILHIYILGIKTYSIDY